MPGSASLLIKAQTRPVPVEAATILDGFTITGGNADGQYPDNRGGGMYNDASSPILINTVLWGNTAGISDTQIHNFDMSTPSIQYSDVQGGCAAIPGNDCSGGGNIGAGPLFVRHPHPGAGGAWSTGDNDVGDLRLQIGSPLIDAGDNTAPRLVGVTTHLDGNPRFYDVPEIADTGVGRAPMVDMGAYERHANHAPAAADDNYSSAEDLPLHVGAPGILANDADPDGDSLCVVLESGPSSGALTLKPDGSFDYPPATDFAGVVTFSYRSTDGVLESSAAMVTVTVRELSEVYLPVIIR